MLIESLSPDLVVRRLSPQDQAIDMGFMLVAVFGCTAMALTITKRAYDDERRAVRDSMRRLAVTNAELSAALHDIKQLRGLVPICSACKSVRDDAGYWQRVEGYIEERTDAVFTHGLCPPCIARLYPNEEGVSELE